MTTTTAPTPKPTAARRLAGWLHARPRVRLAGLLFAPIAWLGVIYLGSLLILLLNAFWTRDAFTGQTIYEPTLENFAKLVEDPYPAIAVRTVVMAALVTVSCAILAFPIAFYMAKVASPRMRSLLAVAILMPLWASYLVKIYAWRVILAEEGILNVVLEPLGLKGPGYGDVGLWLTFTYLWLPYMVLPIFAGLERIPGSLLEASADLGGKSLMTFRRVILPLVFPAVVAGSIFTFSLTLGDYIVPTLLSNTIFIGNAIYANFGAGNFPLAAALTILPLVVILVYLLLARRLGAFEAL
ncbi:MAG TPA: ABC transporter permease [Candidatus Limnocylindrales bacterium]|nr:ABC transporter permease [Candidatus Limnocylindrales bacterium]